MQRYESLIEELEKKYPTQNLRYKGHSIWPLFRVCLFYHGMLESRGGAVVGEVALPVKTFKVKLGDIWVAFIHYKEVFKKFRAHHKLSKQFQSINPLYSNKVGKHDVVFFYSQAHRTQQIGNGTSNIFLDPLQQIVQAKYSSVILEDISDPTNARKVAFDNSFNISVEIRKAELKFAFKKMMTNVSLLASFTRKERVEGFSELCALLPAELKKSIFNTDEFLINQMEQVLAYYNVFCKILKKINPKILVQTSFYHPIGFGLNMASNKLNIKALEMQHGVLEPMAFWNYNTLQETKFLMLPKFYWVFDLDSYGTIKDWISDDKRIVLGGNIWARTMFKKLTFNENIDSEFKEKCDNYKLKVLISLQPDPYLELPDYFFQVMKDRQDIYWLIRAHPRTSKTDIVLVKEWMKNRNITNYDVEFSNKISLPALIKNVDINVTRFSSVTFECALSNVPTIFIDLYAKSVFERDYPLLWNSSFIKLALDKNEFLQNIIFFEESRESLNLDGYFGNDNYLESFERILNY